MAKDATPTDAPTPPPAPRGLRYIGDGAAVVDVPARDLTPAEADAYGRAALVASGLYEEA